MHRQPSVPTLLLTLLLGACCPRPPGAEFRPTPMPRPAEVARPAVGPVASQRAAWTAPTPDALNVRASAAMHDEAGWTQALSRDPGTALCRACYFPGGGHFYTGESTRGALLLGTAAASLLAGALLSDSEAAGECVYNPNTHACRDSRGRRPLFIGAGAAAGAWTFGIIDAKASVRRVNARRAGSGGPGLETRSLLRMERDRLATAMEVRLVW